MYIYVRAATHKYLIPSESSNLRMMHTVKKDETDVKILSVMLNFQKGCMVPVIIITLTPRN